MNLLVITQKVDKNDAILGFFISWLNEIAKDVEKVQVICLFKGNYQLPANVDVFSLGKELGKGRISRYFKFYKLAKKLLPETDAVLAHMCPEYIVAINKFNKKTNKPLFLWFTSKGVSKYLIKAEKVVKKIFTASKESCRIVSNKIVVTGHGIDSNYFMPKKEKKANESFKIISVGRIAPVKNYEMLLEALNMIDLEIKNKIKVKLIGEALLKKDRRYLKDLELEIQNSKLDNIIEFVGPIAYQEIVSYFQNADLFINLSKTGSVDKAVLEAMAVCVPILTSNESFKEILPQEYLVKQDDSKTLAQKITQFYRVRPVMDLRPIILNNHSLDKLIPRLIQEMEEYA